MRREISRRLLLAGTPILCASAAFAGLFHQSLPNDLDLSLRKPSQGLAYVAAIAPAQEPVSVGSMHSWVLTLTTAAGEPVREAAIGIDGGMPQHGHGLPTSPAVTRNFGDGRFLIEGMRFNMRGWWELRFTIEGPEGTDRVTFNVVL